MICVEGTWLWPYETKDISEAYTEFTDWSENMANSNWYRNADGSSKHTAGSVINR